MKTKILTLTAILLAFFLPTVHAAHAQDAGETAKIQYLIKSIESLQGVKFIRNGNEYDSTRAADHLRYKLKKAGSRVKTAEDFIQLCSKSYLSGEAYRMRYPDGTTITAETFFRQRLKEYK